METRVLGPPLTVREREVAQLIGRGLTNRQIAKELGISDRTVGAHVQNILNKLGANNRSQIAAWAVQRPQPASTTTPSAPSGAATAAPAARPRLKVRPRIVAAAVIAIGVVAVVPAVLLLGQSRDSTPIPHGALVFNATFAADRAEFGDRYTFADPNASKIRLTNGAIEYSVFGVGGWTGNALTIDPMQFYLAEYAISVAPRSNVAFWLLFSPRTPEGGGIHQLEIDTALESMQLMYGDPGEESALAPPVRISGLLTGRTIKIEALIRPPRYVIWLDGNRVVDVTHVPSAPLRSPAFEIRGDDVGTVRVAGIRIYSVS